MIKLTDILREGRTLSVFDFDDTLAKTDAWIYIKGPKGEKKLNPAEFAVYKPKEGEEFDFRDFDKKLQNPRIIKKNVDLLKKQLAKAHSRKVTILTARSLGFPIKHFFKTLGLEVYVVPLGDANPQKKADWIEAHVAKGYTKIYFMDDSAKNIRAVDKRMKKHPNVKVITRLIR